MKIINTLSERIETALTAAGAPDGSASLLVNSKNPDFGDYQANGVMSVAKKLKLNPRELATKVIEQLEISDIADKIEVAGPGFINIFLNKNWLAKQLLAANSSALNLIDKEASKEKVVVDYSGPNLAKEMHVGHLRSTIIGDAVANVLELLGNEVIRQNHVGDWGTQFGMLITLLAEQQNQEKQLVLSDLEQFYRAAKLRFDEDADFATRARQNVVALQSGDPQCLKLWQAFTDQSLAHCFDIYKRLGVTLNEAHTYPESAYNPELPKVIESLSQKNLLKESEGAQCVFLDGYETKDGTPLPIIVQKSDGGFLYATTDLAAIRYRYEKLKANRMLYFVDIRQSLHFKQMFQLSRLVNFAGQQVSLEHMPFGTMLGEDKRPFKTRSGDLVKLEDLLNEAEARAYDLVNEKQAELADDEKKRIARQVGIGAVKYADLSKNRTSDYVFSWESMLSFEGNTAPYLQYAFARVQSIFRKFAELNKGKGGECSQPSELTLNEDAERKLALKILQVNDVLVSVAKGGFPHYLCEYLFELTQAYMSFYEQCPVLNAEDANLVQMRLYLCKLTASTLKLGLDALGIETPESM